MPWCATGTRAGSVWRPTGRVPAGRVAAGRREASARPFRLPDLLHIRRQQPLRLALLATVAPPVFLPESLRFLDGTVDLGPLAMPEYDLVAVGQYLKRLLHLVQVVELHRPRFVKVLEIRWVHKIAHVHSPHLEIERLHRIRTFVGIDRLGIGSGRHQVGGWIRSEE